jgi:GAF domain-containing protein
MINAENKTLEQSAKALLEGKHTAVSNMANLSSLIFERINGLNWAGFYIFENGVLTLGPFQGRAACTEIELGCGVCGIAAEEQKTVVVEDVHKFKGHIACDCASNSEIVVPILKKDGSLFGVLDIDSPQIARFGPREKELFESLVEIFKQACGL